MTDSQIPTDQSGIVIDIWLSITVSCLDSL